MRLRRSLLAVLALLIASPVLADEVTVASWNLNHFSGQDLVGCKPRTQKDYDSIRTIINNIDADVWFFQEVESVGALARILDPVVWAFHAEDRPAPQNPGKCRDSDNTFGMQRTALAIKKDRLIGKPHDLQFLDTSQRGNLRYGVAALINVKGLLVELINVHLKSGCFKGTTSDACSTLFEQIPYLMSYIAEADRSGRAVLVGGDFNRQLSASGDDAMKTLGYNSDVGLEISSVTGTSKCSLSGEPPIDYQLTTRKFRGIAKIDMASEYTFTGPFKEWPSDHCPMVVRYNTD